ncbi:hypothetical protein ACOMHN_007960 [Nucella lapillus]
MYANEIEQREKMFPTRPPDVPEPEPEEERTVKSILTSFAESTTMHGLAKVGSPHRRGWATYNVTLILMNFSSNPISTLVTVRFEDRQPFPAITICNLNQVLQSQLSGNIKLKSLREKLEEKMPDWDRLLEDGERFRQELEEFAKNLAGVNGTQNFSSFFASYPFPPDVGERIQRLGEGLNLSFPPDVGERIQRLGEGLNLSFPPDILGFPLKPTRPPGAIPPGGTTIPAAPFPGAASTVHTRDIVPVYDPTISIIIIYFNKAIVIAAAAVVILVFLFYVFYYFYFVNCVIINRVIVKFQQYINCLHVNHYGEMVWRFEDPDYQSEYSEYHWEGEGVEEPAQAEAIEKSEESRAEIRSFMDRLSPKERFQFGHQMLEMLVECRYHTHTRCSFKNFTRFYNHYFGNCFTFNKDESVDSVSKPGPLYAFCRCLSLSAYTQPSAGAFPSAYTQPSAGAFPSLPVPFPLCRCLSLSAYTQPSAGAFPSDYTQPSAGAFPSLPVPFPLCRCLSLSAGAFPSDYTQPSAGAFPSLPVPFPLTTLSPLPVPFPLTTLSLLPVPFPLTTLSPLPVPFPLCRCLSLSAYTQPSAGAFPSDYTQPSAGAFPSLPVPFPLTTLSPLPVPFPLTTLSLLPVPFPLTTLSLLPVPFPLCLHSALCRCLSLSAYTQPSAGAFPSLPVPFPLPTLSLLPVPFPLTTLSLLPPSAGAFPSDYTQPSAGAFPSDYTQPSAGAFPSDYTQPSAGAFPSLPVPFPLTTLSLLPVPFPLCRCLSLSAGAFPSDYTQPSAGAFPSAYTQPSAGAFPSAYTQPSAGAFSSLPTLSLLPVPFPLTTLRLEPMTSLFWAPLGEADGSVGLTLLLNVQSDQYIQLSDTVGLKVLVHPQDSMPFPEDEGVIISPGFTTNIAIKMQEFRRSPPPYEQCKYYSEEENRMLNMYALPPYRVNYTEEACQRTCYQRTVVQSCGCCDGDYPCIEHSPAIPAHNIGFCQSPMEKHSPAIPADNIGFWQSPMEMLCMKKVHHDLEHLSGVVVAVVCAVFPVLCMKKVHHDLEHLSGFVVAVVCAVFPVLCMKKVHHDLENSELGCADECGAETIYSGEVSMGVWPPDSALKVMKKRFRDHPVLSNFTDIQDFRNNIAKLSIFFKQLNYEKFETFPSYDWYRLLSDLGGQLGLWLGVSLLTFVELLELLCQVLAHLGRRAHHTGHSLTRSLTNNGPKTAPPAAPV